MKKTGWKFLGIGLVAMALIGCQTLHPSAHKTKPTSKSTPKPDIQDGAPSGPIPTFFKALIPKSEPLSRYGNPATYKVGGHRYAVMNSSKGFKQRGLASWYGTKFHSRRTSSGEHYDMYALTAAHKTLPLPTYVRVKNLDNGRTAIVKVNDRGPFHPGRIIDLSYGAASKLGVFPKGTARVEIEAITVNDRQKRSIAASQYYIQAGAFKTKQSAEQLRRQIRRSFSAHVFVAYENHRYLVRIGPFADRKRMEAMQAQLPKKGIRGSFSLLA
ncbi:MAG: septal ring lytic transglycosylase RlpA family protein [Gammaproteobacteria bacterium]